VLNDILQVWPKGGMDIQGAGEGVISLTLTVPFACRFEANCPLYVQMYIPGRTDDCTVSTLKSVEKTNIACGTEFTKDDVGQHKNITLKAELGDNFNSIFLNQEFAVFLQISANAHTFIHGDLLDPVRVCLNLFTLNRNQLFCYCTLYPVQYICKTSFVPLIHG